MSQISFKTKIWLFVTGFSSFVLLLAFFILSLGYYFFSLNSFKNDLINSTEEIFENHLVFDRDQIFFKRDDNNRTISAYLRDKNMSAVFFDKNNDPFAEYGVYQRLIDENVVIDKIEDNTPTFFEKSFYPNEEFFVLTTPILFENSKVGMVQIALSTPFFSQIKSMGLYILLIIIFVCFLISWPLSRWLISYLLKPLESLVESMRTSQITNLNVPIETAGMANDEIAILVGSYNKMIARISLGIDNQKAFISQASHELKTPLARAISSLDVILLDKKDKNVEAVRDDLYEFSNLINELLILSKVDSGTIKIVKTRVSMVKALAESIENLSTEIEKKKIFLDINCSSNLHIKSDENHLKLILSNLLSNAIKYSRSRGKIIVDIVNVNNFVSIKITDHGIGISDQDLHKIFDRFFRSSSVSGTQGFGIGLALVKQICNLHKLEIKYDSKFGHGTTVTVSGLEVA